MDGSENSNGLLLEHQWPPLDGRIRNLEMLRVEISKWSVFNSLSAQVAYIERKERTELYMAKNGVLPQTSSFFF